MTTTYKTPYDIRVVEFHLRNGTVSHADYAKHLTDLPNDDQEWDAVLQHAVETRMCPSIRELFVTILIFVVL